MAKELLVVESRVREALKELMPDGRLSNDALEGLDAVVREIISKAVKRCQANGRKTLIKDDF
jgi:histone H3/H4